ncbi:hypothetical protein GHT07_09100 [Caenimonas koreensis DSM 17982]|uniref:DUF4258 domain-containing protein n=1 Tax=Caenimonas koreensis DSM 17982 TaxID=1121255 RepID=A0A844B2J5_9BURK|nr:hypothetical protein [Caenimonas koreensis]MRD47433.1 hypothetical protein [Caenimonas koreensis DSM 17982]
MPPDPASGIRLTTHASIRLQQHGSPSWFLALLMQHGKSMHDGHGAVLKTVNKDTRRRLQGVLSRTQYAQAERFFDVYAVVVGEEVVVTAAHRTRRRCIH